MAYGRDGDYLYLHGSIASRLTKTNKFDAPVCCTVTLLDGLVIARSLFNHSMQYRSVVIFGTANEITEASEIDRAIQVITNHIIPGRDQQSRCASPAELKATRFLKVEIESASLKLSENGPEDDASDIEENKYWAGVIPIKQTFGDPIPDQIHPPKEECPPNILNYKR